MAGSRDDAAAGPTSRTHITTHILQSLRYFGDRGCKPRSSIPDFGGKAANGDQSQLRGHVCGGLSVLLILWSSQADCFAYVTFPCSANACANTAAVFAGCLSVKLACQAKAIVHKQYHHWTPSNNLQKREVLYQVITDCLRSEDKKASLASLPMPYNIIAADMNAALFKQDVQRAKPDAKDTMHQKFIKDLQLHTTDPDKHPHRLYSFRHATNSSQDSRIDDILVSESMCTDMAAHTEVLDTSSDADHAPILSQNTTHLHEMFEARS